MSSESPPGDWPARFMQLLRRPMTRRRLFLLGAKATWHGAKILAPPIIGYPIARWLWGSSGVDSELAHRLEWLATLAPALPSPNGVRLLGLDRKDIDLYAGPGHPVYLGRTHPADLDALAVTAKATGLRRLLERGSVHVSERLPSRLNGTKIVFGGPTSQFLPRVFLEFDGEGDSLTKDPNPVLRFPFRGMSDASQAKHEPILMPGMALGQRVLRPNWGFIESDGTCHEPRVQPNGKLEYDFVVLTRMRNFLPPGWEQEQSYIVHIDGASDVGAGTRAVESLLADDRLAGNLLAQVGESFSILFRVHDIPYGEDPQEPGRVCVGAGNLDMIGEPRKLDFDVATYHEAHLRAQHRLKKPNEPLVAGLPG